MTPVIIHTDGSGTREGNPGGWAAVLRFGDKYREISGNVPDATNNRMELQAVIESLRVLNGRRVVHLFTDSEYVRLNVLNQLGRWVQNGWRTHTDNPVANRDLWEQVYEQLRQHQVTVFHVEGHSGVEDNERADVLAGIERRKLLPPKVRKVRGKRAKVAEVVGNGIEANV